MMTMENTGLEPVAIGEKTHIKQHHESSRHRINSILELMGNFNSKIAYLKKVESENLELEFATKNI